MTKINVSEEWCLRMADLEGDSEVGAGTLALTPLGRVWCLSPWEPICSLSEYYLEEVPWRRLWSSYVVMPAGARFLGRTYGQSEKK